MLAFCPSCGKEVSGGAAFCSNCGFALGKAAGEGGSSGGSEEVRARINKILATGSVPGPIDLNKVAKSHPGTEYNPKQFPGLVFRLKSPRADLLIFGSGKILCTGTLLESEARSAIREVVNQLKSEVPIHSEPTIEISNIVAELNFGRGIDVALVPEGIPDSWFLNRAILWSWCDGGGSFHGRYFSDGAVVKIPSKEDAGRMGFLKPMDLLTYPEPGKVEVQVIPQSRTAPEGGPKPWPGMTTCACLLHSEGKTCIILMFRDRDEDRQTLKNGPIIMTGVRSEAQVMDYARLFGRMLDEGKLFRQ